MKKRTVTFNITAMEFDGKEYGDDFLVDCTIDIEFTGKINCRLLAGLANDAILKNLKDCLKGKLINTTVSFSR